jgi:4a-hydroxytetrahydrobiopterin dehydratase
MTRRGRPDKGKRRAALAPARAGVERPGEATPVAVAEAHNRGLAMPEQKPHVYSDAEVPAKLAEYGLPGWYLEDGWLRRKYTTGGWPITLMLVNAVGFLCEAADHHADLIVTYAKLWVKLKTHSAGGITDKDFALARQVEATALWHPPAGGPLKGATDKFVQGG